MLMTQRPRETVSISPSVQKNTSSLIPSGRHAYSKATLASDRYRRAAVLVNTPLFQNILLLPIVTLKGGSMNALAIPLRYPE